MTATSRPSRATTRARRDTAAFEAGSVSVSVPAVGRTGTTTSSESTVRPGFDSSTCGAGASINGITRPSTRAARTSSPAGISTRTQPSLSTSTVSRASPLADSPFTRSS